MKGLSPDNIAIAIASVNQIGDSSTIATIHASRSANTRARHENEQRLA